MRFTTNYKKRIIVVILLLFIFVSPAIWGASADAVFFATFPEKYDLVAILVEKKLYLDTENYEGLASRYPEILQQTTLKARVDRYASDIQKKLDSARAVIIKVEKNALPENVASVLERLYFEGDPQEPERNAKLAGVVLIGEVPLPVVNKNGNRFISLFPYTDFEEPAYVFNPQTRDFEIDGTVRMPKPEAWHGVIRSPKKEDQNFIAQYLDKNHLYHEDKLGFADAAKKVFFSDLFWEKKGISPLLLGHYQNFIDHMEDVAYFRYTKELLGSLFDEFEGKMNEEGLSAENFVDTLSGATPQQKNELKEQQRKQKEEQKHSEKGIRDAAKEQNPDAEFPPAESPPESGGESSPQAQVPDIQTKKIIQKYLAEYKDLFSKFPALVNDAIRGTGRYDPETDLDSPINLITAKDKFTWLYLRTVNDMVENEMEKIVDEVQQNIPLIAEVEVKLTGIKPKIPSSLAQTIRDAIPARIVPETPLRPPAGTSMLAVFTPATFSNHSPLNDSSDDNEDDNRPARILGRSMSDVSDVSQCTLYRGSIGEPVSKLVEANRLNHIRSLALCPDELAAIGLCEKDSVIDQTTDEKKANFLDVSKPFLEHAGCNTGGICFPDLASKPIFHYGGAKKAENPPANYDNYASCYMWRDKKTYSETLAGVDGFVLAPLRDFECSDDEEDASPCDYVGFIENYRTLSGLTYPQDRAPFLLPQPNRFTLFSFASNISGVGNFSVTFADLLRGLGFSNPDWSTVSRELFAKNTAVETRTVLLNQNFVESADVSISRRIVKTIPSVFYHKEPTIQAIDHQWKAQATTDLPIDSPRYVTFQDKAFRLQKVLYPNLFRSISLGDFSTKLKEKEDELTRIAKAAGNADANFSGRLQGLFQSGPDAVEDKKMKKASQQKISDSIDWRNMDLEAKHRYIFLTYLNKNKNGFVGERDGGYELVYVNSSGDPNAFDIDFQIEKVEEEAPDLSREKAVASRTPQTLIEETTGTCTAIPSPVGAGPYLIWDFGGGLPGCSPWFLAMKQWMKEIEAVTQQFQTGESESEFAEALAQKQAEALARQKEEAALAEQQLYTAPELHGDTSRISGVELKADFPVLFRGGGSVTPISILIKDKDAKILEDEAARATVTIEGSSVEFANPSEDENPDAEGFQKTIIGGQDAIHIVSTDTKGISKIKVSVAYTDLTDELAVTVSDEAKLLIETERPGVVANGEEEIPFFVKAVDENLQVISGIFGDARVSVSDSVYGELREDTVHLQNGIGEGVLKVGKLAGEVTIHAAGGPLLPGSLQLSLLPGPPAFLSIIPESTVLDFSPGSLMKISGKVMDEFGNPVTTDNRTRVKFEVLEPRTSGRLGTDASASGSIRVQNGVAETTLFPGSKPGAIRLKLSDAAGKLQSASITIQAHYRITSQDILQNPIEALTVALLGMPAGNVQDENALAPAFLSSGKVEAVTTLTAPPTAGKRLLEINSQGGVFISDTSKITPHVNSGEPVTIEFRSADTVEKVGELIFTPKPDLAWFDASSENEISEKSPEGAYLKIFDTALSSKKTGSSFSLFSGKIEKVRIINRAGISLFDAAFSLQLKTGPFLAIEILKAGQVVAEVDFIQNFENNVSLSSTGPYPQGVTVRPFQTLGKVHFEPIFSGNSTNSPRGIALVSEEESMEKNALPGFSYLSLEDSFQKFGIGLSEQNKFALLFSGGSSVGEASLPYASDAGIVFGDPTVRIDNSRENKHSTDVGKHIFSAPSDIREILNFDYNNDGYEDMLLVYDKGSLRLFENNGEKKGFEDRGLLLNIKSGIAGIAKGDFDRDGQMDLIVAGSEVCIQGDTCIDIYKNSHGIFTRENLAIDQKEKPQSIQTADLNQDGRLDLIVVDTAGNIKAYYGKNPGFELRGQIIGNMGLKISASKNLIQSVLARYDGLRDPDPSDTAASAKFRGVEWIVPAPEKSNASLFRNSTAQFTEDPPEKSEKANFIFPDLDEALKNSQKFAVDLNGGVAETGDSIEYTIILKNSSTRHLRNVKIADLIPDAVQVDAATIACKNCEPREQVTIRKTTDPSRPFIVEGLTVPSNGQRTIKYSAVYAATIAESPKILVTVGNNFSDDYRIKDKYLDLAVTVEGNRTGSLRYFYSTSLNEKGFVRYDSVLSSPDAPDDSGADTSYLSQSPEESIAETKRRIEREVKKAKEEPSEENLENNPYFQSAQKQQEKRENEDSDTDGMPDELDDFISADGEIGQALTKVADKVEGVISSLQCNPGCIPLPINMAFLSPGLFTVLGFPVGPDPGIPVLAFTVPGLPPVWPPWPGWMLSFFRLYLSPTLTGGLGTAMCVGPWMGPYPFATNCWVFAVNPLALIAKDACDAISGSIEGGLAKANAAIAKANQGLTISVSGVQSGGGSDPRSSSGFSNYQLGGYDAPASKSMNIRIPGFPKVLTDWLSAQIDEVVDKLTDLPDLYIVYPDIKRFFGENVAQSVRSFKRAKFRSMDDFLTYVNSIPLIDIEQKEVEFKIPIVTKKEIERIKADADQWVVDLKNEVKRVKNLWGCLKPVGSGEFDDVAEKCRFLEVRSEALIKSLNDNITALDEWIALPKKVMDYRFIEAFYAKQIADYLDVVAKATGGYLKRQKSIIKLWEREIRNAIRTIKTWQGILDILLEYQESCDQCTTQRFTLIELILRLFVAIPTPPVIPFPKFPDFVFDISKIQAGWRIIWPKIKFKPYPFVLPKLPRIRIPDLLPQIALVLPELPVIPAPPPLPQLPALPPLNIPLLPDLPPAPKLPGIPQEIQVLIDILKKIIKILCLILKAIIPFPEWTLKTQIELMTARGLSPLLPLDLMITIVLPEIKITYVDKIVVTTFLNLQPETGFVYEKVHGFSEDFNKVTTKFVDQFNQMVKKAFEKVEQFTSPTLPESLQNDLNNFSNKKEIQMYVPSGGKQAKGGIFDRIPPEQLAQVEAIKQALNTLMPQLEKLQEKQQKEIAMIPKETVIPVTSIPYQKASLKDIGDGSTNFEKTILSAKRELERYIASIKGANPVLEGGDLENYSRLIADLQTPFEIPLKQQLFASANFSWENRAPSGKTNAGEWDPTLPAEKAAQMQTEPLKQKSDALQESFRLLAQAGGGAPAADGASAQPSAGNPIPVETAGLFTANPVTGESERILSYVAELNASRRMISFDFDRDRDEDLFYTSGADLFVKEFGKKKPPEDQFHFSDRYIEFFDLSEVLPKFPAPKPFRNVGEGTHDATVNFAGAGDITGPDFGGYSFFFKRTPNMQDIALRSDNFVLDVIPNNDENFGSEIREIGEPKQKVPIEKATAVIQNADEVFLIEGKKRSVQEESDDVILVKKGEIIHPLESGTEITLYPDKANETTIALSNFETLPIGDLFGGDLPIRVEDGAVEIIGTEEWQNVPLREGSIILENEQIRIFDEAKVGYAHGAFKAIGSQTIFSWQFTDDIVSPQVRIENLDPANYFARVAAFSKDGKYGTRSEKILLNPQLCGDHTPPMMDAGSASFQVPLLKTLSFDAKNSKDDRGKIVRFTLDTDTATDSDGDGDPMNDTDIDNGVRSKFSIGPFAELGTFPMRLTGYDESKNAGFTDVTVEVIEPTVLIHPESLREGKIEGHIEPRDKDVPIAIGRNRNSAWNFVKTPSADQNGRYLTDTAGIFSVKDLDLRDRYVVKNEEGKNVAEIHKKTGQTVIVDSRYHLEALPAAPPSLPTRVAIVDEKGAILTYVFFVPDVNNDTTIDPPSVEYNRSTLKNLHGVHIKPVENLPSEFSFEIMPGDHIEIPGATVLAKSRMRIATIDVNGDIIFFDPQLKLTVKERAFDEPVVFELWYDGQKLAEIFIVSHLPGDKKVKIIHGGDAVAPLRPRPSTATTGVLPFTDVEINDPLAPTLKNLYDKGIIEGYTTPRGQLEFRKERLISRAEFTKITLDMLCIDPRAEAKKAPPVFSDIPFKNPPEWFYDDTKEANLQGFIFGYLREISSATKLAPFKPGNNITRAEAAKIILEALQTLGAIDLSKANLQSEIWYKPYIEIAQNLAPYLKEKEGVAQTFIVTAQEAAQPTERITRGQFAEMADRVLKLRNCFAFDLDKDRLPDSWEKKYGDNLSLLNENDDLDRDGLKNIEEYPLGTNPLDPDTDKGGIKDGVEVKERRTNPLDPRDDRPTAPRESRESEENIFVVRPDCDRCPCFADVAEGADLLPGDTVFAAIMKEDDSEIFVKSEDVTY